MALFVKEMKMAPPPALNRDLVFTWLSMIHACEGSSHSSSKDEVRRDMDLVSSTVYTVEKGPVSMCDAPGPHHPAAAPHQELVRGLPLYSPVGDKSLF